MATDYTFNFGSRDPLLSSEGDYLEQLRRLDEAQKSLEQRKRTIMQMGEQAGVASLTPVWDEIDALTASMTAEEFSAIQGNESYQESLQALMTLVSAVQLRAIRPQIEQSPEGKKILDEHLATIKHLRKSASSEMEKRLAAFRDYTENYSHLSWDEYSKAKGGAKKK